MGDRLDTNIKTQVNRGLAWVGLASASVGLLDVVARILILAIWISPEQLGTAILAVSLFPVLDRATDLGLSAAVIQRDDHSDAKMSTVFWFNVALSLTIFALLWLVIGPALGALHGRPIVGDLLTVYGLKLVWQNVYFMPWALMTRELRFKELSVIRIFANLAEFAGKVGFAAAGFGIWCFVFGPLCRVLVTGIGIQIRHPWRPRAVLRIRETLGWAGFGAKAAGSKVLFYLYTNVDYQVVGYYFGEKANGYYTLAYEVVLEPCRIISDVISSVAFPSFARLKYARDKVVDQFIVFTRMNLVVMIAFLGLVFVSTPEIIGLLYGEKWMPSVDATRILCAVGLLRALSFVVPPLLDGVGKPALTLVYMITASIVLPGCFVLGAVVLGPRYDWLSVAIAWAVGYPIAFVVLFAMALMVMELRLRDYLRRSLGIPALAAVAMLASAGVHWATQPLPAGVRLASTALVMVGLFLVLLAYKEGISPRSVMRSIKGD
ncbi:MAG TPA: oligosaccharide flippase family protein [Kofleriaceae bacterium]|nr:oligosaccharide flippase family protein [Kofleriaceae bacterium]